MVSLSDSFVVSVVLSFPHSSTTAMLVAYGVIFASPMYKRLVLGNRRENGK